MSCAVATRFTPGAIPTDTPSGLKAFLADTLRQIASALNGPVVLQVLGEEPAKLKDGMTVIAVSPWNPGGGDGVYARISGAWVKL